MNGKQESESIEMWDHKRKKEKVKDEDSTLPFRRLFSYADSTDYLLMVFGTLAAVLQGGGFPVVFVIFGDVADAFIEIGIYLQCDLNYTTCFQQNYTNFTRSEWDVSVAPLADLFEERTLEYSVYFIYCGIAIFILGLVHIGCWSLQAARQVQRIKSAYFKAVLRQDISFHEKTSAGELTVRLTNDIEIIQLGIGGKVSLTIQYFCTTISSIILGFISSWQLTLVSLGIAPMLGISSVLIIVLLGINVKKELQAYAEGGAIADEAISSVRTVTSLGCQKKFVDRYYEAIKKAKPVAIKGGFINGFSYGFFDFTLFGMIGVAFWFGSKLIIDGVIGISAFFSFFGVLVGTFALGTALANFESFSQARAAGAKVFEVIDRNPSIDIFSEEGEDPQKGSVGITFEKVKFSYPCRPDIEILHGLSLKIEKGQNVALVGQSGCGKSTIIQLIQRFYDCQSGDIMIGDQKLKKLNLKKHRDQIGVVSQEPVLFATTIAENIRWGREGVTDQEIHEAARQANAYDFIMKLPNKFDSLVGEGGGQLSGGQKQRIAIARAIVRNPKILLLDEATSALDTESESIVQAALDKVCSGRATVVVAHRLSTIRDADKIVVLENGRVVEEGSHEELIKIEGGKYRYLVDLQFSEESGEVDVIMSEVDLNEVIESPNSKPKLRKQNSAFTFSRKRSKFRKTVDFGRRTAYASDVVNRRNTFNRSSRKQSFRLEDLNVISPLAGPRPTLTSVEETKELSSEVLEEEESLADVSFLDILKWNRQEWGFILLGCIAAACGGSAIPFFSILFADILVSLTRNNLEDQIYYSTLYSLLVLAIGVGLFVFFIIEAACFAKSGVELVLRLRREAFKSILRQDISFFDDPINNSGALSAKLSLDASRLQGATGPRIGIIVKSVTTLGFSLAIAFFYTWKLSLAILAFIPLQALGSFFESKVIKDSEKGESESELKAGNIANETIRNIHTIASLSMEEISVEQYRIATVKSPRSLFLKSLAKGLAYSFGACIIYFAYAVTFRLGSVLVLNQEVAFENVFKVLVSLLFGAVITGQNVSIAPNYAEAKLSAARLFTLLGRSPVVNPDSDEGSKPAHCKGSISLKSVYFAYPTNTSMPILRRMNIKVKQGETLALVGQSGCGKSSIIRLVERFYDPQRGSIEVDGLDTKMLNVSWLRHQIGLVSQEPVLFNLSIQENIRYGDCSREVSDNEIIEAAKNANIHEFIDSLPQKYSTNVGAKGSQLSGGQKQRIAIARALLREPKILLLDEATSALDVESEKVVQKTLDDAKEGRTTIVIAHRLITVKNADKIAVVENGLVVESGTHMELLDRKGPYFSLWKTQQGS